MKALSYRKVVKILLGNGFHLSRSKGSHEIYKNQAGKIVIVAFHGKSKMIPAGTSSAIVEQSELPKELFE